MTVLYEMEGDREGDSGLDIPWDFRNLCVTGEDCQFVSCYVS